MLMSPVLVLLAGLGLPGGSSYRSSKSWNANASDLDPVAFDGGSVLVQDEYLEKAGEVINGTDPERWRLLPHEIYLAPYLGELVQYREHAVLSQFIRLLEVVDVVPAWITNVIIGLVLPDGGTLTLHVDKTWHLYLPLGKMKLRAPVSLKIRTIQAKHLNKFVTLRPLTLNHRSSFTFEGDIEMERVKVVVDASMRVFFMRMDIFITIEVLRPAIGYEFLLAFAKKKLCEAFGSTMLKGACIAYPIFTKEDESWWKEGKSGFKVINYKLGFKDIGINVDIEGGFMASTVRKAVTALVNKVNSDHQEMLRALEENKGLILDIGNQGLNNLLQKQNKKGSMLRSWFASVSGPADGYALHCVNEALRNYGAPVSKVCFYNQAGFALRMDYMHCPTGKVSRKTRAFSAGFKECMNVKEYIPDIRYGEVIRIQTSPVAGLVLMPDPPLIYKPNSNTASFHCTGTTFIYKCEFASLVPLSGAPPPAEQFCVYNKAGFAMYTDAVNLRTRQRIGRGSAFTALQKNCANLTSSPGVQEGDEFQINADAIAGKNNNMNRNVVYKKNGRTVSFECKGTTFHYSCDVME